MNFYVTFTKNIKISIYMFVVNAFKCGLLVAVSAPVNGLNEAWDLNLGGCLKFSTAHDSNLLQGWGLHICTGTVNVTVYIRIEMRTINKCMIGTRHLSVVLLVSQYSLYFS